MINSMAASTSTALLSGTSSSCSVDAQSSSRGNGNGKPDLRLIQQLRVRIVEARNVHCGRGSGSGSKMFCLVRLDREDLFQSSTVTKCSSVIFGDDRHMDVTGAFRQMHFYLCDVAGSGRVPRPFARCSLDKTRILEHAGKKARSGELWLPLKPYRRQTDISGKVCLEVIYDQQPVTLDQLSDSRRGSFTHSDMEAHSVNASAHSQPHIKIRILDHSDLYEASSSSSSSSTSTPASNLSSSGSSHHQHMPDVYALVSVHVNGQDQTGTHKLRLPKHDIHSTPNTLPFAVIPLSRLLSVSQSTLISSMSDSGIGTSTLPRHTSDTQSDTCLRVSLWHDVLGGFQSYFHGEVRVPLDANTYKPCTAPNSADGGLVAWYYLKPRSAGTDGGSEQGELRVQVDYSLTYLLPSAHYHEMCCLLLDSITSSRACPSVFVCTCLGVLDMLPRVDIEQVARPIMKVALQSERLRPLVKVTAAWEMSICRSQEAGPSEDDIPPVFDVNTLFRSTSFATKLVSELMKFVGSQYLYTTLKPIIDKIYNDNRSCEIDPLRLEPGASLEANRQCLLEYASSIFARMVDSAHRCPQLLKDVFSDLRELATLYFPGRTDVQRLVISSFLLMRFFSAAVLNPKMFGLKKENPCTNVARSLALVSKTIQRVSNSVVSERALTSKEPWMDEVLEVFMTDDRARHMCRFLDRVSCGATGEISCSGDSVNTLKEGMLIEKSEKQRHCLQMSWMSQRRRFVLLTENELLIYKRSSPMRSLSLSHIDVIQPADSHSLAKNTMHISSVDKLQSVFLQAATSCELNDWLYALRKQCHRVQQPRANSTSNMDSSSAGAGMCHLYDIDMDRELEHIRAIYMSHVETMKHWKNYLDNSAPLPPDCAPIPRDYQLSACVNGASNAAQYSDAQRSRMLHRSLNDLLCCLFTLEQSHREHFKRFVRQVKHGSKEHPIGDDNYLLLKSRLRELFPSATGNGNNGNGSGGSSTSWPTDHHPPPVTLAPSLPPPTSGSAIMSTSTMSNTMTTSSSSTPAFMSGGQ